jgi:hypothetical protein
MLKTLIKIQTVWKGALCAPQKLRSQPTHHCHHHHDNLIIKIRKACEKYYLEDSFCLLNAFGAHIGTWGISFTLIRAMHPL